MKMNNESSVNQLPKVSVITVVYNSRDCLEITLLSVINQSYQNIEFIIIDGGSTDGTVDLIKQYEKSITYWISEKDEGIYDAMNKALEVVTGDWVYFLGAGDIMLDVLAKIMPVFKNPNHVYYGDVYRTDLLKVFDGKFSVFRASRMCICHQAIFYPVEAIRKYKFNTKYKVQADHNLNMEIQGSGSYRFEYFKTIVCIYSGDGFSAVTRDVAFFKDRLSIVKINFPYIVYLYAFWLDKFLKVIKRGEYRTSK
jgi:glycosyltransferase involved in cell wall biosynthesis